MSTQHMLSSTSYPPGNGEAVAVATPPGMSMGSTIARAFTYNTGSAFLSQCISFIRSIVLARLLLPADFGLFGMATMTILATDVLLNFQLNVSLIPRAFQDVAEEKRWLNTVWTLEQARGFVVFLFSCVLAWPVASYFGDSRVFPIIVAASLASLLGGFNNVGMTLHQKNINFRNVVIWEQASAVVGLAITVGLAYWMRSALALAWGYALTALCKIILSYALHPYRPSWGIDREAMRGSVRFGGSLLVIGILTYVTTQFDNVIIGKWLGASLLGAYLLAYQLAMLPVVFLSGIVHRTMFPVYSRVLRESRPRAFELWAQTAKYTAWALLLICVPAWATRDSLIHLVYGGKWDAAVAPFAILIFAGLLRAMTHVSAAMLLALGQPHIDARAKMVETVVFVALVLALVGPYGTVGAAWAGAVCYALAFLLRTISVAWQERGMLRQLWSFLPNLAIGLAAGLGSAWGLKQSGTTLFLALPAVALAIASCGLLLEGRNLKVLLRVWKEPPTAA